MDGKWNDKWAIMVRKWMKDMSISDEKMNNSKAQHLPQTKLVACPHATQYLCRFQTRYTHAIVVFILPCIVTKTTTFPLMMLKKYDSYF